MLSLPRTLPQGPLLVFSSLTAVDRPMMFRGHAIKYVLQGEERYTVNGRPFVVGPGEYLVANPLGQGHAFIEGSAPVIGLCADLPPAMVDGMVAALVRPDEPERHSMLGYFNSDEFVENTYEARNTRTGAAIGALAASLRHDPFGEHAVPMDLYLHLAEAYVADQRAVLPMLRKVRAVRTSTRKELLRGVERARQLIHDAFAERLDVTMMARAAAMSEFHFFRAFRQIHGRTPHKYLSDLRLKRAAHLLAAQDAPVMDVALRCGFADAASFTKAFRNAYGMPPGAWRCRSRSF